MADIRPLAIDDTDSIIRSFHLDLQPTAEPNLEPQAEALARTDVVAQQEVAVKTEAETQPESAAVAAETDTITQPESAAPQTEAATKPESVAQTNGESVAHKTPDPESQTQPLAQPEPVQVS